MSVQLNHTIIWCHDKQRSATFLTEILGLPAPKPFGPFLVVELSNGVSLDFYQIFGRIRERGLEHWADPGQHRPGEINRNDGGRGVYFEDPDGHLLEIITRPYGSGGQIEAQG